MGVVNDYSYWQRKLAAPDERLPVGQDDYQPGFYRTKNGDAVAIWHEEDGTVIMVNDEIVDSRRYPQVWQFCADRAVSEEWYKEKIDSGRWPDVDDAVAEIGHNRFAADIEGVIQDLAKAADQYQKISSDEEMARAQSLRSRLLEKKGEAEKAHAREKAPINKAGRKIDEAWKPMIKVAEKGADYLRWLISAWETYKRDEERRRLEEVDRSVVAEGGRPELPAPKAQVKGGVGRAASLREVTVLDKVLDLDALAVHYARRPMVHDAILKAVAHDLRDGHEVPHIRTKRIVDVR